MVTKIDDLMQQKFISETLLSPNGSLIGFIVSESRKDLDGYDLGLYIIGAKDGELVRSYNDIKLNSFAWLDDERLIVGEYKDNETEFISIGLDGGRNTYCRLPFEAKLEFISKDKDLIVSAYRPINKEKSEEYGGYKILDEYPFWYDGRGFTSKIRRQLFLCGPNRDYSLISPNKMDVESSYYDPESNMIVYYGNIIEKIKPDDSSIFLYDIKRSKITELVGHGKWRVKHIGVLGHKPVFVASDASLSHFKDPLIITVDIETKKQTIIASPGLSIDNTIVADSRYGGGYLFKCVNEKLYFVVTKDHSSQLYSMDENFKVQQVTKDIGSIDFFDVVDNKIVFVGLRNMMLQEVYKVEDNKEIILTGLNGGVEYPRPIDLKYMNPEGFEVCGLLLKSSNGVKYDKSPLVLCIHGGPKAAFGHVFHHEMQTLSSEGYYVACCNPTGSDGKGDIFGDISGRWATRDYEDIIGFVDKILEVFPEIDENRIAIFGGSYGGYMTNWIIGHTNRFKTAISDRSISNCISKDVTGDNAIRFGEMHMKTNVHKNPAYMWDRSPLKYAPNVKTPTLFIHGIEDYRCHYSEAIMMYTALRANGVKARLALFKGENHDLCRTGKPKNRIRRLEEVKSWLSKNL